MDWLADDFDDLDNLPVETFHPSRTDGHFAFQTHDLKDDIEMSPVMPAQQHHIPNGVRLIPTSTLPDMFRQLFKFGVFNAMQSQVYNAVMESTANLVISAPTGSGKTVVFELALVHLQRGKTDRKCVYMAPTKALCSERFRDWTEKFSTLGIKFNYVMTVEPSNRRFSITTPEMFDSLSRNWRDNSGFILQIGLFLIDEVQILNDTRGSTLEVVISRMKSRASLRFIVVSATVPNVNDVADWVGNESSTGPATVFTFGEQYRPCRLSRFIYGFSRKNNNDFTFDRSLDYRLLPLLSVHANNKPILIFCSTRKGTVATAETLMKEYGKLLEAKQHVPWARPPCLDTLFADQKLQELASYGIGVHHAGLGLEDRRLIENLFLKKTIQVVVATSTLAVGVNLREWSASQSAVSSDSEPETAAHTVVIKGVKTWQNGEWGNYSELDIIQMIGRAGRPQFDKEGVAVILCDTEQEKKLKAMATEQTCLESCLHHNLVEHVNSEIGLGTITDLATAKGWLHNSFLFHRIQKNPRHYALNKSSEQTWQSRMDELVETSISDLKQNDLINAASNNEYKATEYGDIMSKFYIRLNTMKAVMSLPETANIREILQTVSNAEELGELRFRSGEKQIYRKLAEHNDIRFPTKVEKASDKVFLLIQAVLGGLSLNAPEFKSADSQPFLEAITILRHAIRIVRTIIEVALVKKQGLVLKCGMELLRGLNGKAWEDRPIVLRQIEHVGEKSIKVLAQNSITTLAALRKTKPSHLELILNRRPPFGTQILNAVSELPQYCLNVIDSCIQPSKKNEPITVELTIECRLNKEPGETKLNSKRKPVALGMTSILTLTNEFAFVDFRRIPTRALCHPKVFSVSVAFEKPSQSVLITASPDNFAGLSVTTTYKPSISAEKYPVPQTKPLCYDVDEILAGLEDDPTFWQTTIDSDEPPATQIVEKATAAQKSSQRANQLADHTKNSSVSSNSKLPNGNYRCNHTCKRKNQCRHLCCRDGLPQPPRRSSVPCSQTNQPKYRVSPKKITSFKGQTKEGARPSTANKPSALTGAFCLSLKKRLQVPVLTAKKQDTVELIDSASEKSLTSLSDELWKNFEDVCDENIIIIDDSENATQSMLTDDTTQGSPVLSSQSKKRKHSAVTVPQESKRQKMNSESKNVVICLKETETINSTPLFLLSSPNRNETELDMQSFQSFAYSGVYGDLADQNRDETELDMQSFQSFANSGVYGDFRDQNGNEKNRMDQCQVNEEPNQPLDAYARDYAELCAWLNEVAE